MKSELITTSMHLLRFSCNCFTLPYLLHRIPFSSNLMCRSRLLSFLLRVSRFRLHPYLLRARRCRPDRNRCEAIEERRALEGEIILKCLARTEQQGQVASEADDTPDNLKDDGPVEWVSYWKPNITIKLVDDFTQYPKTGAPPNIAPHLNIDPISENYYPTVFFNEFWLLRDKLIPVNETVTELPLHLEVGPISMTKWQLFQEVDQSFQIHRSYGSMLEGEGDELKSRRQPMGSNLCGFYVLRHIFNIISKGTTEFTQEMFDQIDPFTEGDMDYIRECWSEFFIDLLQQ